MLSPYKFIVEQKEDYVQRLNLGEMLSEIESQASCEVNEWVTVISLLYKNDIYWLAFCTTQKAKRGVYKERWKPGFSNFTNPLPHLSPISSLPLFSRGSQKTWRLPGCWSFFQNSPVSFQPHTSTEWPCSSNALISNGRLSVIYLLLGSSILNFYL